MVGETIKLEEYKKINNIFVATTYVYTFKPGPQVLAWRPLDINYKASPRRKSFARGRFRGKPEMKLHIEGETSRDEYFEIYGLLIFGGSTWTNVRWDDPNSPGVLANPAKIPEEAYWRLIAPTFVPNQQSDGSPPTASTSQGDDIFLAFDQASELSWVQEGGDTRILDVDSSTRQPGYKYHLVMERVRREV